MAEKLRTFVVSAEVTISIHTRVEAHSEEDATRIAEARGMQHFCHQCSSSDGADEEWRTSGELDGTPTCLVAEEE